MNPERQRKGKLKAKKIIDIEESQYDYDPWYDYHYRRRNRNERKAELEMSYEEKRFRRLSKHRHKGWNDNPRRKDRWGGSEKTLQERREDDKYNEENE
jgi:hypothetical protein